MIKREGHVTDLNWKTAVVQAPHHSALNEGRENNTNTKGVFTLKHIKVELKDMRKMIKHPLGSVV